MYVFQEKIKINIYIEQIAEIQKLKLEGKKIDIVLIKS